MKTKIVLTSLGVILSAIIITIIVLASLQSNGGLSHDNPSKIKIYKSGIDASYTYTKDDARYSKIIEMYNDMTERSMLEQIVGGNFSNTLPQENINALAWSEYNKTSGIYVEFLFDREQKITVCRDEHTRSLKVMGLIFRINNDNSYKTINIYYKTTENYETKDADGETVYPLMVNANTSKLYKYLVG